MTNKNKNNVEHLDGDSVGDFFFWFAPGTKEPISVTRDEFDALIEKNIQERDDYLNVRTRN